MKKISFVVFAALVALFSFKNLQAQSVSSNQIIFEKESFGNSISNMSDADKLALENIRLASAKAYQNFTSKFQGATNINMSEGKNAIFISCSTDGGFNRITYNRKGRWRHTVRTYGNQKLAADIREQVENVYPRFTIFGSVIEVHASNKVAYLVTIEDKKSWKRIRVVDGETDVYEEYNK